jgi:hypothetical protein
MSRYNSGDVIINNLSVSVGWDLIANFLSASVVESIFTPGVHAEIEVIDYLDWLGQYQLQGGETVNFNFTKPNGATANYDFALNAIHNVELHGAMKSKVYKLDCISKEVLSGQAGQVQKKYNSPISGMVGDILRSVFQPTLPLDIASTQGTRNMQIFNQRGSNAIEMLRKEAVSPNGTSNFLFFITQRAIHFKTFEDMISSGDVKTFKQENTVGHSLFADIDSNILAWQVIQNMDAMNRVKAGINDQVATFNFLTNQFKKQTTAGKASTGMGSNQITTNSQFSGLFNNMFRTIVRPIMASDNLNIPKSFMPDAIPDKTAGLAQWTEQLMRCTVIGDPVLEAGHTILCNVPKITSESNNTEPEPQMSGRWLISKLEHHIARADIKPRYTCNIEGLKGSYQT